MTEVLTKYNVRDKVSLKSIHECSHYHVLTHKNPNENVFIFPLVCSYRSFRSLTQAVRVYKKLINVYEEIFVL